ncbi:MAG: hypothetical protein IKX67_07140 [Bacteroidales bacterium]|nr:hypothetical protein [Bacteroidales bacterium]
MSDEGTYYGIGLETSQIKRDGQAVIDEFGNIDRAAASAGKGVDTLAGKMRYSVQSLEDAFKKSRDTFDGTIDELKDGISKTKDYLTELKLRYRDTLAAANRSGNQGMRSALRQLRQEIALEEASLQGLEARYKSFSSNTAPSFRNQMMTIANQMKQLRLEEKQDTEEYRNLEAQMRRLVEVERQFAIERQNMAKGAGAVFSGLMSGVQGMMGAYTAASGILGALSDDQEKLIAIQTKLQSSMSILMGMQQMANTLNATSAFRVTVVTRATQLWHTWNLRTATGLLRLGTSAQFARAAAIGLHSGLLLLGGAAVIAAIAVISKLTEEQKKAREEQKKWRDQVGQNVASQLAEYRRLQAEWQACNGDLERQKAVVEKNGEAWEKLGFKVDDVTSYEKVAVENSDVVVNAMMARAKAAAYASLAETKYAKAIELRLAAENAGTKWYQNMIIGLAGSNGAADVDQQEAMRADFIEKNRQDLLNEASQLEKEADDLIKNGISQNNIAADLLKGLPTVVRNTTDATTKTYEDALAEILKQTENFKKQLTSEQREGVRDSFNAEIDVAKSREDWETYFRAKRDLAKFNYEQEKADALAAYEATEKEVAARRIEWQKNGWDTTALDEQLQTASDLYNQTCDNIEAKFKVTTDKINDESAKNASDQMQAYLDLLREFETYKQAEERINREYDEKIAKMDPVKDASNIEKAEKERKKALSSLKAEELAETDVFKKLMGDLSLFTTELLTTYIDTAEDLLNTTQNLSSEDLKNYLAAIKNAREEVMRRNPFEALKKAYNEYQKAMESGDDAAKRKAAGQMSSAVNESNAQIQSIASSVSDLMTLFGERGERLSAVLQNVGSVVNSASNAISAFEAAEAGEGSYGSAIAGAIAYLYTAGKFFKNLSESLNEEDSHVWYDRQDFLAKYALFLSKLKSEDFDTIFGRKSIEATADAYKKMGEALRQYQEQYKEVGSIWGGRSEKDYFDYDRVMKYAGKQKFGGDVRDMVVRTYKSLTGFFDRYQRLSDLAPELWGGDPVNGEFNVDAAKLFLETNTQITDEQRKQLQLLIEQKEAYEEASKYIDDSISNTFKDLGSEITDIIWDSVVNGGGNALEQFGQLGSKYVSKLGKEFLQQMVVTEYLEQFRDQMRNAYGLGSPQEIQSEMRNIVGSIFGGIHKMFEAGTAVAEEYKAWALANGFDLSETDESTRKAATKSALGYTQESVDESNARLTTVQGHTFELNENVKEMRNQHAQLVANSAALLEHVQGIHSDTDAMRETLAEVRNLAGTIKNNVGTIVDRGVKAI